MFCRNCGKELSDKAVACIGCGMNPKEGISHCQACGEGTKDKQIICTACGGSLTQGSSEGWSTGAYSGLLILSFIVPLFGWIYGGVKANTAPHNSQRKNQSWHYVISASIGFILVLAIS